MLLLKGKKTWANSSVMIVLMMMMVVTMMIMITMIVTILMITG